MDEIKVSTLNNQGEKLVGIKTTPSPAEGKLPTVILVHGFGVDKEESGMFTDLAQKLSEAGILSYRFDFSGCGESEGDYSETSLSKLKSDLAKILKFVHQQPEVDSTRTGILAQSFGTSVTVALEPNVKTIILMGSIARPYKLMKELFKEDFHPDGTSLQKRSGGNITKVKPIFWQDLKQYDLLKCMKKISCPILFIHGEKDDKVPVSEMWAFYRAKKGDKETDVEKGAGHNLKPKRQGVYLLVEDWFNRYLKR